MAACRTGIQEVRIDKVNRERRDYNETQEGWTQCSERHDEGSVNTWWLLTDREWAKDIIIK